MNRLSTTARRPSLAPIQCIDKNISSTISLYFECLGTWRCAYSLFWSLFSRHWVWSNDTGKAMSTNGSLLSVLSAHPLLSKTSSYLSSYPDLLATTSGLRDVTFLAPANYAWDNCYNTSEIMSQDNFNQLVFNYHTLNGNYANFGSDTIVSTNLRSPVYTNVTGGAIVKYLYGSDNFISGLDLASGVGSVSPSFHNDYNL